MDTEVDGAIPRKLPVQERSRRRVERMLSAATEMIAEGGSDALTMSAVASRAGVSIGSLYQFFPDRTAVVAALMERCHEASRRCIGEALLGLEGLDRLEEAFGALVDVYYAQFLADPAMRDIWAAGQADRTLAAVQLAESRRNGALLAETLKRLAPAARADAIETSSLLVMHLGEETMRLAIALDPEAGRKVVDAYKHLAVAELLAVTR